MNAWVAFSSDHQTYFGRVPDSATVGSGASTYFRLPDPALSPLRGQLLRDGARIKWRDFRDRKELDLKTSEALSFDSSWHLQILEQEEFFECYRSVILEKFRAEMSFREGLSPRDQIQRFSEKYFFGRDLPLEIERELQSQFSEISLESPVEHLIAEDGITDILVNAFDQIFVDQAGRLQRTPYRFVSEASYRVYVENLLARHQLGLSEVNPCLDFVLAGGERAHVIGPPLTSGSIHLSIRKHTAARYTLATLSEGGMFPHSVFEFLRKDVIHDRLNILVAGATGSGKTTLIRALLREIPENSRTLIMEDTPELEIEGSGTLFLRTRSDQKGDLPKILLRDLVRQSLRMRPDRIVIGEVRGEEAMDLLHAMNTGHRGSMASLHANSARDALFRLQGLIQMSDARLSEPVVRDLIARNIHAVIFCSRNSEGSRVVSEVVRMRGIDQSNFLLETVHEIT